MRVMIPLCFVAFLFLPLPNPAGLSFIAQAQAVPSDALVRQCRRAVFRKYGRRNAQGKRLLSATFATSMTDACVARGGRVL
jgi:hypothetical protein